MADDNLSHLFDRARLCLNTECRREVIGHGNRRYCSKICQRAGRHRGAEKYVPEPPEHKYPQRKRLICKTCSKLFPYGGSSKKPPAYCSEGCLLKGYKANSLRWRDRNVDHIKNQSKSRYANKTPANFTCIICASSFPSKWREAKCCSLKCIREYQSQLGLEQTKAVTIWRDCLGCGRQFRPYRSGRASLRAKQLYCSKGCKDGKAGAVQAKGPKYRSKSAVDPIAVFKRDEWICHLCGRRTPKKLRGTTNDLAPELDHIIPISAGGPDTYDNVACACRRCNRLKDATLIPRSIAFGLGYFPGITESPLGANTGSELELPVYRW